MRLSIEQLGRMSRLLDEALELDDAGRARWLEQLAARDHDLREALREALQPQGTDVAGAGPRRLAATAALQMTFGAAAPDAGDRVGPYLLVRQLGAGGMAQVWLAQRADGAFKREVALKLPTLRGERHDLAGRFARETDILAGLEHPNIARLYDAGVAPDGLPYLAMEYVDGRPITSWCDERKLSVPARLRLFLQVLAAVQYAHGKGVIHRDIKPTNILVTGDGQARLLDFGVARLLMHDTVRDTVEAAPSQAGPAVDVAVRAGGSELTEVFGRALTPQYASPELLRGEAFDATADIYALGVLLYELLAGRRPYELSSNSSDELEKAISTVRIVPPSVNLSTRQAGALQGDLDAIVLKCLEKKASDRYGTAQDLAEDLQRHLERRPVRARPAGAAYRLSRFTQRNALVLGLCGVIAVLAGAEVRMSARRTAGDAMAGALPAAALEPIGEKSIAVLPFANLSSDREQDYFSDGLAEQLMDQLAKTPGLHVVARTSSFYFKDRQMPVPEIARTLRVASILTGSVRKSGSRIRVTTQLIRGSTAESIWSETYDRELKDVFEVQDEITAAVVAALKVQLSAASAAVQVSGTANAAAYSAYLQGRQFGDQGTEDGWRNAIAAFRRAIALEPGYANAWAELAMNEADLADSSGDAAALQRAIDDAGRAVALGPALAQAYAVRGRIREIWQWDWAGARQDYAKASTLSADDPTTLMRYGAALCEAGDCRRGLPMLRHAADLDPLSASVLDNLSRVLAASGQLAEAIATSRKALALQPGNVIVRWGLTQAQLLDGRPVEALSTAAANRDETFRLQGVAMAEHSLGHGAASRAALDELIRRHDRESAYQIAQVFAWREERDSAFDWLERAWRQRDGGLSSLKGDPAFARMRADPRLHALLRRINYPD